MYSQADQIPNGSVLSGFDICIAGGGVAAIAMATRLAGSSKNVLVLCNGTSTDSGQNPNPNLESMYQGTLGAFMTKVDPNFTTRSRLNMYGGSSNHFWLFAHPMRDSDLEARPGYRNAHWPISLDELNRYYPDANELCQYGPFNYEDIDFWAKAMKCTPLPSQPGGSIENAIWHGQKDPTIHQFQTQFGPALLAATNVTVLFNANVLKVDSTSGKDHVTGLDCATVDNGQPGIRFRVEAASYVLALGGIEPVRLLKLSGGLGDNKKGLLGKGFMLHPLIQNAAQVTLPNPIAQATQNFYAMQQVTLDQPKKKGGTHRVVNHILFHPGELKGRISLYAWGMLRPTPQALAANKTGTFHSTVNFNATGNLVTLGINWESVPNENSTITLDRAKKDPVFGLPVAHVNWNLLEQEKRTIRTGLNFLKQYFAGLGSTGFEITTDLSGGPGHWTFDPGQTNLAAIETGDHHMGAVRMSAAPADGIVDTELRVHAIDNLFVAGSGVYPTTGDSNPTLTIVALALRLADHLKNLST